MLISVPIIVLEKVYVSALQNLKIVFNTLTDKDKYCLLFRDNLTQPIQILLCQKKNTFSHLFSGFLKSTLNFVDFEKKMTLIADVFPKLPSPKKVIR